MTGILFEAGIKKTGGKKTLLVFLRKKYLHVHCTITVITETVINYLFWSYFWATNQRFFKSFIRPAWKKSFKTTAK
jgi:hypothetical protein